jgi:hypothetical protein
MEMNRLREFAAKRTARERTDYTAAVVFALLSLLVLLPAILAS